MPKSTTRQRRPEPSRGFGIGDAARQAFEGTQRLLIAQAACRVIDREGLQRTSMRRIADELDCSVGLIQHHFSNKEDVLVAALRAALAQVHEDVAERYPVVPDIKALRDPFVESLRSRTEDSLYWRVVIAYRGAALSSERLRQELRDHEPEDMEHVKRCLATEFGADIEDEDVVLMADALRAALDGLATAAVLDPETYTADRIGPMIDAIIHGVLSPAGRVSTR